MGIRTYKDDKKLFFGRNNQDELQLIKDIVNKVSKMIRPLTPRVKDNLVGIEARMDALISNMQNGSECVLMIGIWGVGGGGKTTLANSVYSKIYSEYDGCCFIENIRDESLKNGVAGSFNWFAKGSRIIITTRNVHLLKAHEVVVHGISLLNNDEATKLLRKWVNNLINRCKQSG
ncbi:hypothetical protein LXL04_038655 [Taraxacum kok-saghyz]